MPNNCAVCGAGLWVCVDPRADIANELHLIRHEVTLLNKTLIKFADYLLASANTQE